MSTNPFTHTRVPEPLLHFKAGSETRTIRPTSLLYYTTRVAREMVADPFNPEGLTDPAKPITVEHLTMIDLEAIGDSVQKDALRKELIFLMELGLAYESGRVHYVSHLAEVFYHDDGLFANPKSQTAATAVAKLMLGVVLPGMYWRLHYQGEVLPETVALSVQSRETMKAILNAVAAKDHHTE